MDNVAFTETITTIPGAPATLPVVSASIVPGDKKVEAPVAAVPKAEDKPEVSQRFAALARKEQSIVQKDMALKAREQEITARSTQIEAVLAAKKAEDLLWETNPQEALQKRGWDYDKWTKLVLSGETITPDMIAKKAVREEVSAWEKKQEEARAEAAKKAADSAKVAEEKAVADFKADIHNFYSEDAQKDKYELINLHEAGQLVYDTIDAHYQKTFKAGKAEILAIEKACDLVEEWLVEQVKKSTETKKMSSLLGKSVEPAGGVPAKTETKSSPSVPSRTLTNNLTSSAQGVRPLTREERIKRAMTLKVG